MQAHIAEHVGYAYRDKMQHGSWLCLTMTEDDELPEDMERELSRMMAEAAPQVLSESQAMVAQQQAAQNAQDPVLQIADCKTSNARTRRPRLKEKEAR